MSGTILRFKKTKTTKTSKLRFLRLELYEDATLAHFSLSAPHAEYRFSLAPAQEVDDAFAIYQTADSYFEIVELDAFIELDKTTLDENLDEARELMQEQLKVWKGLTMTDRLGLQIQWATDLQGELTGRVRDLTARAPLEDVNDILMDLLSEIEWLSHFKAGVNAALLCV